MLCISTSKRMLAHAFAWSKTIKNTWKWVLKSTFFIMHTKDTWEAYEEKWRKKFVGQQLGVTPKSWSTHFQMFLIVFDHAFAGQNTQQAAINLEINLTILQLHKTGPSLNFWLKNTKTHRLNSGDLINSLVRNLDHGYLCDH